MSPKAISSNSTYRGRAAVQRQRGQLQSILMIAAGILIVIFVVFSLISKSPAQNVVPARMGAALGDFKLTDLNGKTVQLSDYKGRPVLINAWATWCPY